MSSSSAAPGASASGGSKATTCVPFHKKANSSLPLALADEGAVIVERRHVLVAGQAPIRWVVAEAGCLARPSLTQLEHGLLGGDDGQRVATEPDDLRRPSRRVVEGDRHHHGGGEVGRQHVGAHVDPLAGVVAHDAGDRCPDTGDVELGGRQPVHPGAEECVAFDELAQSAEHGVLDRRAGGQPVGGDRGEAVLGPRRR